MTTRTRTLRPFLDGAGDVLHAPGDPIPIHFLIAIAGFALETR